MSGDLARLEDRWATGALMSPHGDTASVYDLAVALSHIGGARVELTPRAQGVLDVVESPDHIVFVLVDGLGMNLVERLPEDAFFRRSVAMELRTVYPSSTAPALTTLATAEWPASHSVTGWWLFLPSAAVTATILPFTERFSDSRLSRGLAQDAFPAQGMLGAFARDVAVYMPRAIAASVYSTYAAGGNQCIGWGSLANAVDLITSRVELALSPTYSYLYVPFVDAAQHVHGPFDAAVTKTLRQVQSQIGRLAARLGARARIVVSADHGVTPPDVIHTWDRTEPLIALLRFPPSGEPRAPCFHVREGKLAEFFDMFRQRYGNAFALLTLDQADSCNLFGRQGMSDETRRRLGDAVGIALGADVLLYEPAPALANMKGFHGGMLPDEMRVPLIVA